VLVAGAGTSQLTKHGRLARVGEPLLFQPAQRAITAKRLDRPRYAAGRPAALSSTMPNCSTSFDALGNWPTVSPLRSSLATAKAVGRSATSASISPLLNAILASPVVLYTSTGTSPSTDVAAL